MKKYSKDYYYNKAKKFYISGRITGLPGEQAKKHFARIADDLEGKGYEVFNPFSFNDKCETGDWAKCMVVNIEMLFKCNHVFMLNNWEKSRGARIEHFIAQEMGMNICYEEEDRE